MGSAYPWCMAEIRYQLQSDLPNAVAWLSGFRKQSNFAMSRALNRIAPEAQKAISGASRSFFDRPTKYVVNAWRYNAKATRDNLMVEVYPEQSREPYLRANIFGGTRGIKPFEARFKGIADTRPPGQVLVPGPRVRRDSQGNVSRGTITGISSRIAPSGRNSVFIGKPLGKDKPWGIYQRMGTKRKPYIRPLFISAPQARYNPIFPVEKIGHTVVERRLERYYEQELAKALATAR